MTDSFISKNKLPIIVTAIIVILGMAAYFFWVPRFAEAATQSSPAALKLLGSDALQLKAAYTPEGTLKIFALAKNSDLLRIKAAEGSSLPEYNSVVIGSKEAGAMKGEKLFTKTDDKLTKFFGTNVSVSGVLTSTNSPVDDFHFVGDSNFAAIRGDSDVLFVRLLDGKMPKLFYTLSPSQIQNTSLKLSLAQGNVTNYKVSSLAGVTYYPVIIGANEAAVMRGEKLFTNIGDTIRGFFGNDVVIVGVLAKSNTPLDDVHILPLTNAQVR